MTVWNWDVVLSYLRMNRDKLQCFGVEQWHKLQLFFLCNSARKNILQWICRHLLYRKWSKRQLPVQAGTTIMSKWGYFRSVRCETQSQSVSKENVTATYIQVSRSWASRSPPWPWSLSRWNSGRQPTRPCYTRSRAPWCRTTGTGRRKTTWWWRYSRGPPWNW